MGVLSDNRSLLESVQVALTREEKKELRDWSKILDCSQSAFCRDAITQYMEEWRDKHRRITHGK